MRKKQCVVSSPIAEFIAATIASVRSRIGLSKRGDFMCTSLNWIIRMFIDSLVDYVLKVSAKMLFAIEDIC